MKKPLIVMAMILGSVSVFFIPVKRIFVLGLAGCGLLILIGGAYYQGFKKRKEAILLEGEGRYKEACYEYAEALQLPSFNTKYCKARIKDLWEKHGPFDYANVLEVARQEPNPEEEEGYHSTVAIIKKIVL